jgi:hypothetical protein
MCVQVLHEKPTLVAHRLACAGNVFDDDYGGGDDDDESGCCVLRDMASLMRCVHDTC